MKEGCNCLCPKSRRGAIVDAPKPLGGAIYDAPKARGGAIFDASSGAPGSGFIKNCSIVKAIKQTKDNTNAGVSA